MRKPCSGRIRKAHDMSRIGPVKGSRVCTAAMILCFFVFSLFLPGCNREVRSETGLDDLNCMIRLGVFPAGTEDSVNENITRFDAVLALEKLLGAGSENRTADYFRSIYYTKSVDFFVDAAGGAQAAPEDNVSAAQAYGMCLKALGYGERIDAEGAGAVGNIALEAGFGSGSGSELLSGNKITYGTYSVILSELLLLRTENTKEPVYRILAMMDSSFSDLLEYNGLYDDIPEELCPWFSFGIYVPGSFSAAVSTGRREWNASYSNITKDDLTAYAAYLESEGWTLEGRYASETEEGTVITLYYKEEPSSPDGEMGLVLKTNAQGILSWNLMA